MVAECITDSPTFHDHRHREIVARFDGGAITSDGGGLLLRELEQRTGIIGRFAECFTDHRDPDLIEHSVYELVAQRVYGLCLGYEDLSDHDELRRDPLLALLLGKDDPTGADRLRERDRGRALAGKSRAPTEGWSNRLELTPPGADEASRYQKIVASCAGIERSFVDVFLALHAEPPAEIILDLDATDDPLHGGQLGKFFHGYYKNHCYLPLSIFCGDHLLCAKLRPANIGAAAGSVPELERIVGRIRERWPRVRIAIRADSGFCREPILAWCEDNEVDYVIGLAKNARLKEIIAEQSAAAREQFERTGQPARVFADFSYQTLKSWNRERRVIAKAEHLAKGANPRFVITSFSTERFKAKALYEREYCARGEMENRIKEQQLYLFADRTSCESMRANQLRLWFSSIAYVLLNALRQFGLKDTALERARCDTIRVKVLKIGAQVRVTFRKIWLHLASGYPYQSLLAQACENLRRAFPVPLRVSSALAPSNRESFAEIRAPGAPGSGCRGPCSRPSRWNREHSIPLDVIPVDYTQVRQDFP